MSGSVQAAPLIRSSLCPSELPLRLQTRHAVSDFHSVTLVASHITLNTSRLLGDPDASMISQNNSIVTKMQELQPIPEESGSKDE